MENLIDILKAKDSFHFAMGVKEKEIRTVEQTLGLKFDKEYRDCLLSFGIVSFQGHELTGITRFPRLDVVEQTLAEKRKNRHIPDDFYVIEVANIDGIVIWQKSSGEIFQTVFDSAPVQICSSLTEYVNL